MKNSIYIVYHIEAWVGTFFQAAFSDRELAQVYIDSMDSGYQEDCYIEEYSLDSQTVWTA